jgi:hypothetical protein
MDSKTRFAKAIDSQFAHLGRAAVYIKSLSEPQDIIVIARRPEQLFELGDGHLHAENPQLEFRVSEVSSPKMSKLTVDGFGESSLTVHREPDSDKFPKLCLYRRQ